MPVDELKLAIDEWVWPMSFADRDPSDRLRIFRHALSLDDKRPTFRRPVEQVVEKKRQAEAKALDTHRGPEVWFAGVHANVGGGYPDDGLAITALKWMMDEAAAQGLRFERLIHDEIVAHVNPDGEEYDSRSGIAGYYRYGPRRVSALCRMKITVCGFRRCACTRLPMGGLPSAAATMSRSAWTRLSRSAP